MNIITRIVILIILIIVVSNFDIGNISSIDNSTYTNDEILLILEDD